MKKEEIIRFLVLRTLGNFLVLISLYGVFATFGPALSYEIQYRIIQLRGLHFVVQDNKTWTFRSTAIVKDNQVAGGLRPTPVPPKTVSFADILAGDKKQILIPSDPLFSILIPKIGASAKVFPNVDPENPNEYLPILQQGVAHAKGSVFPGSSGVTYLFAHSTDNWWDVGRYNAVFYTLNYLTDNDEIDVFFQNVRYTYLVKQKMITDPQDISLLTKSHEGEEQLVLQTCWPPGTTWKRLYVIAERKKK